MLGSVKIMPFEKIKCEVNQINVDKDQTLSEFQKFQFILNISFILFINYNLPEVSNKVDLPLTIVAEKIIFISILVKELSSVHNVMKFSNLAILAPQFEYCDEIYSKVINFTPECHKPYECKKIFNN